MKKNCRNCGRDANFTYIYNDPQLLKCSICCGYQWMGNTPNPEILYTQDYFNGNEYIAYERSARIYKINLKRKLQEILNTPYFKEKTPEDRCHEHIFELGSATGEFLKILQKNSFSNILGSEISSFCRKTAAQSKFELLNPLSDQYMSSIKKFNPKVICAWDVWEHLENPQAFFTEVLVGNPQINLVALTTVDSGALVPKIKKKRWRQFHPPTHLNYPTKKSFDLFFKKCGFRIQRSRSFGYFRPVADYLSVLIGRKNVANFPFLFKIPFYLNLYDIQMVIAERSK